MTDTREYISNLAMPEKITLFKELYNELAGYGIDGDTELAHVNTFEASLLKSLGGSGTLNEITNFKEYKGGGGTPPAPPPATTQTVTQTSEFPTELKPFISDVLGEAKGEFGREKAVGFEAFPGPQLARFTPEQEAAFAAGREQFTGLAGTPLGRAATYYEPALAATALGTAEIGAEDIGRRMDPFLQNVVDIAKRESEEDEERARQQRAARAVQGQGFLGGTRIPLVVEEQARQAQAQRLGDIQARGLSVSFQNAQRAAEQQRQREMLGGRQFAALGDVTGARAREDIRGLVGTGEVQQARTQQALDIARREFEEEKAFPQTALQRYASIIRGFPLTPAQTTLATRREAPPSLAQTLTGAGLGAAGIYGMFGGFNPPRSQVASTGGLVSLQEGGQPGGMNINMGRGGGGGYSPYIPPTGAPPMGGINMDEIIEELARRGMSRSNGGLMSIVRRQNDGLLSFIGADNPSTANMSPTQIQKLMLGDFNITPISTTIEPTVPLSEEDILRQRLSELYAGQQTGLAEQEKAAEGLLEKMSFEDLPTRQEDIRKFYTEEADLAKARAERAGERKGMGFSLAALSAAPEFFVPGRTWGESAQAAGKEAMPIIGKTVEAAYEAEDIADTQAAARRAAQRGEEIAAPRDVIKDELAKINLQRTLTQDRQILNKLGVEEAKIWLAFEQQEIDRLLAYGLRSLEFDLTPRAQVAELLEGTFGKTLHTSDYPEAHTIVTAARSIMIERDKGLTAPSSIEFNQELEALINEMAWEKWPGKTRTPTSSTSSGTEPTVTGGSGSEEDALTAATDYKFDPNFPVD